MRRLEDPIKYDKPDGRTGTIRWYSDEQQALRLLSADGTIKAATAALHRSLPPEYDASGRRFTAAMHQALAAAIEARALPGPHPARGAQLAAVRPAGALAPALVFRHLDGRELRLRELRGAPVLLCFVQLATDRGGTTCREQLPRIEEIHRQWGPRGLRVLVVDVEGDAGQVEEVAAALQVPIVRGTVADMDAFGVYSVPTAVVLDRRGAIVSSDLLFFGRSHEADMGAALDCAAA